PRVARHREDRHLATVADLIAALKEAPAGVDERAIHLDDRRALARRRVEHHDAAAEHRRPAGPRIGVDLERVESEREGELVRRFLARGAAQYQVRALPLPERHPPLDL